MNPAVARIAGPQLANYLKLVGSKLTGLSTDLGSKVAGAVAGSKTLQAIGAGTPLEAAEAVYGIPKIGKVLANIPVPVSAYQRVAPAIPGLAGGAAEMAVLAGIPAVTNQIAQSYGSVDQPFTRQQYVPGTLPMTNWQMAESMLNRQRYNQQLGLVEQARITDLNKLQNQLALLQAKQGQGQSPFGGSIIDLNEDMFSSPAPLYK
jgi:hypothetical protein